METDITRFEEKIRALFAERMIDWQYAHSSLGEDDVFYQNLKQVQVAVYALDEYLEQNWSLAPEQLALFWDGIHVALAPFGLTPNEQEELLSEIRQYQQQEVMTHVEEQPVMAPLRTFYYFKTCDVRLHRRLIQRFDRDPDALPPLTSWLPFDLITEIEDDLNDLTEDEGTYNVNRFLFASRQNTVDAATVEYLAFLEELLVEQPLLGTYAHADLIDRLTREAGNRVRHLLHTLAVPQQASAS